MERLALCSLSPHAPITEPSPQEGKGREQGREEESWYFIHDLSLSARGAVMDGGFAARAGGR